MFIFMIVVFFYYILGIRLLFNLIIIRDVEFRMLVCYVNNNNDNDNDNIYIIKK